MFAKKKTANYFFITESNPIKDSPYETKY